jgi:hypothetical protein
MTIIELPYKVMRRIHARRSRRSKNGTPEERTALAKPTAAIPPKQRRSKNGTPEERAARRNQHVVIIPFKKREVPRTVGTEVAAAEGEGAA